MTTYKYGRVFSLVISGDQNSFDLSDLRVTFSVTHGSTSTPKTLRARIMNLSHGGHGSANTVAAIQAASNKTVTLKAYYGTQTESILFQGTIRQVYAGRISPVDTYLDIAASAFEDVHATATVSKVLAAGWTHEDYLKDVLVGGSSASSAGISVGSFPSIAGSGARPKVCYGNVRSGLRSLSVNTASVLYQNDSGIVDVVPVSDTAKQTTTTTMMLNPGNGLIGIPVQIPEGIQATALLDSRLSPGTVVSIYSRNDSDSRTAVTQQDIDTDYAGTNGGNQITNADGTSSVQGLSKTGEYTILFAEHSGDTRGNTWYTTIVGQATDPSDQSVTTQRGASAV